MHGKPVLKAKMWVRVLSSNMLYVETNDKVEWGLTTEGDVMVIDYAKVSNSKASFID